MLLKFCTFLLLIIFSIISNSSAKLGEKYYFLGIDRENNPNRLKQIGSYGTIGLITNDTIPDLFNSSDIEDETRFNASFLDDHSAISYKFNCRLWNPKNSNLVVLCSNISLPYQRRNLTFYFGSLYYGDNYISIYSDYVYFEFEQLNEKIPFLYSEPQYINLLALQDYYELRFKFENNYPEENLTLTEREEAISLATMNNCSSWNKELICLVQRKKIEEIFTYNDSLALAYLSELNGIFKYDMVLDIKVRYNQTKQDINIVFNEVLNKVSEVNSMIAISTNIANIEPLTTKTFLFEFYDGSI